MVEEALVQGHLVTSSRRMPQVNLPAVEALLQGKWFVSRGLMGQALTDSRYAPEGLAADSSDGIFRVEMDSPMPLNLPEEDRFGALFYDSDAAYCNDCQARMYGLAPPCKT